MSNLRLGEALLILIVLILIILVIFKDMERPYKYLNTNSTLAPVSGVYNPSDLGYEHMRTLRGEKQRVCEEIKRFVGASPKAKVIFNSGATESIATCVNWAKANNQFGTIYGSELDHPSVKANCENQEMNYKLYTKDSDLENPSALFLTHVCSRNGEILDEKRLSIGRRLRSQQRMQSEFDSRTDSSALVPYQPLVFVDASQSVTKLPINMSEMNANAVFFSLHKIGGPMNSGILVIDDDNVLCKFKPLIAGAQNDGLRGGTLNDSAVVLNRNIFKMGLAPETRKDAWEKAVNRLQKAGVELELPKGKHLYNTILMKTEEACPLGVINHLANENVFVGTATACQNERQLNDQLTGGASSSTIRVSFIDGKDLDAKTIDKIARAVHHQK